MHTLDIIFFKFYIVNILKLKYTLGLTSAIINERIIYNNYELFSALCNPQCRHGHCSRPNQCTCYGGYKGTDCSTRNIIHSDCVILSLYIIMSF